MTVLSQLMQCLDDVLSTCSRVTLDPRKSLLRQKVVLNTPGTEVSSATVVTADAPP